MAAVFAGAAQRPERPDPKMLKEIQEYKIKFLAQEMMLKDDQKEKFAELYQQMSNERQANLKHLHSLEKALDNNPSEADYKAITEAMANVKLKDARIEQIYDKKFAKFLSSKQIYKMKEAEEKFRRKMQDMHRQRNKGKRTCRPK